MHAEKGDPRHQAMVGGQQRHQFDGHVKNEANT